MSRQSFKAELESQRHILNGRLDAENAELERVKVVMGAACRASIVTMEKLGAVEALLAHLATLETPRGT